MRNVNKQLFASKAVGTLLGGIIGIIIFPVLFNPLELIFWPLKWSIARIREETNGKNRFSEISKAVLVCLLVLITFPVILAISPFVGSILGAIKGYSEGVLSALTLPQSAFKHHLARLRNSDTPSNVLSIIVTGLICWMAVTAVLLILFPPAGIASIIGAGGTVAATIGLGSLNAYAFASVAASVILGFGALLKGICESVMPKASYPESKIESKSELTNTTTGNLLTTLQGVRITKKWESAKQQNNTRSTEIKISANRGDSPVSKKIVVEQSSFLPNQNDDLQLFELIKQLRKEDDQPKTKYPRFNMRLAKSPEQNVKSSQTPVMAAQ